MLEDVEEKGDNLEELESDRPEDLPIDEESSEVTEPSNRWKEEERLERAVSVTDAETARMEKIAETGTVCTFCGAQIPPGPYFCPSCDKTRADLL